MKKYVLILLVFILVLAFQSATIITEPISKPGLGKLLFLTLFFRGTAPLAAAVAISPFMLLPTP